MATVVPVQMALNSLLTITIVYVSQTFHLIFTKNIVIICSHFEFTQLLEHLLPLLLLAHAWKLDTKTAVLPVTVLEVHQIVPVTQAATC